MKFTKQQAFENLKGALTEGGKPNLRKPAMLPP